MSQSPNHREQPAERPVAVVVSPDPAERAVIRDVLEDCRVRTIGASTESEARDLLRSGPVELLILDVGSGSGNRLRPLVEYARRLEPGPLLLIVDDGDGGESPQAWIDAGAHEVLCRPLAEGALRQATVRALRGVALLRELYQLQQRLQRREGYAQLVGHSPAMERLRAEIDRLATIDTPVWFYGEPGTGKELAARSVHAASVRAASPFVVLHCAGLVGGDGGLHGPADVRGGDTAVPGWFEQSSGGALYLDGVTDMPPRAQAALVHALSGEPRPDVRLYAGATNEPRAAVEQGRLAESLIALLAPVSIALPALAERTEDIALLARHFVGTLTETNRLPPMQISPAVLEALEAYHWPGNVRELRNAMEHAVILAVEGQIQLRDLPDRVREGGRGSEPARAGAGLASREFRAAKREVVERFEAAYLRDLLGRHDGNVTVASQHAGMLRSALQRLLRKYGIKSADYRRSKGAGARRDLPSELVDRS